jgi:hypothetical protein
MGVGRFAAGALNQLYRLPALFVIDVNADNRRTLLREEQCSFTTNTTRSASDEGNLVGQSHCYCSF